MTTFKMHAKCNDNLEVSNTPEGFKLVGNCLAGHGGGVNVQAHMTACETCPRATGAAPTGPVETSVAPEPVAEPVPLALPETAPAGPAPLPMVVTGLADVPPVECSTQTVDSTGLVTLTSVPETGPVSGDNGIPVEIPVQVQEPVIETVVMPTAAVQLHSPPTALVQTGLPALDSIVLPSGMSLESARALQVDVGEQLKKIEGCPWGSSTGGLSAHKLADDTCKRRSYLGQVMGMVPLKYRMPLEFGTLFHAVLAMRYLHGEHRQWEPCDAVEAAGDPAMARKCRTLVNVQVQKYARQEYDTWCVRAVEHNMLAWIPCKIGKKTIAVPISCRIDMILAIKGKDDAHPGPGIVPSGVYLVDWKSASSITYDLIEGYGMDWQFLVQCAVFKLSRAEQIFGPLRGIMVGLAAKAKKQPTFDDFQRIESPVSMPLIDKFIENELKPAAASLYERLTTPSMREDMSQWPMDRRQCKSNGFRCDFFDACDREAFLEYRIDEDRIVTPERLLKAPAGWTAGGGLSKEPLLPGQEPKPKVKSCKVDDEETQILASAVLSQIESDEAFVNLRKENFLSPGHTFKSVQGQLSSSLKAFYEPLAEKKTMFHMHELEWRIQKTGVAWRTKNGLKGRVTWTVVSAWICTNSWFNLSTALPA